MMSVPAGLMFLFAGLLAAGEWLCVNVAWRCTDYSPLHLSLAGVSVALGLVFWAVDQ